MAHKAKRVARIRKRRIERKNWGVLGEDLCTVRRGKILRMQLGC
jgi:hypothetical protein